MLERLADVLEISIIWIIYSNKTVSVLWSTEYEHVIFSSSHNHRHIYGCTQYLGLPQMTPTMCLTFCAIMLQISGRKSSLKSL